MNSLKKKKKKWGVGGGGGAQTGKPKRVQQPKLLLSKASCQPVTTKPTHTQLASLTLMTSIAAAVQAENKLPALVSINH